MSGNYPDGFNQRMHDDYFDRPGPDPGDDEGCDRCLDDMGEHSESCPERANEDTDDEEGCCERCGNLAKWFYAARDGWVCPDCWKHGELPT